MLTLTRKPGEAVLLSGGIRITVGGIHYKKVSLRFEAPGEVEIMRAEIQEGRSLETDTAACESAVAPGFEVTTALAEAAEAFLCARNFYLPNDPEGVQLLDRFRHTCWEYQQWKEKQP